MALTNTVKCTCGADIPVNETKCHHCGAEFKQSTEESAKRIEEICAEIGKITTDFQEKTTPAKTTSVNGFGTMLLDYRPVGDGLYEASRWITVAAIPLIPLSIWKIEPRKYTHLNAGERQFFNLVGKRSITLDRIVRPYFYEVLLVLPFLLAYKFLDLTIPVYFLSHHIGSWVAVGFVFLLIIAALVWVGFIFSRVHNASTAYKNKA
ncbi:MAG TPA: hypothetical protein VFC63_03180 [Blastocatellia bacterium]|nr:hypothetical protein [Blastocatellia bacterium]